MKRRPPPTINETLAASFGQQTLVCGRCGRRMVPAAMNLEAVVHHGACKPECIDRQACERARRRAKGENR